MTYVALKARVAELEAELEKVKAQWEFAAKAQLERSERAETELEKLREENNLLSADLLGLHARPTEYAALSDAYNEQEARAEKAEADRDRLKDASFSEGDVERVAEVVKGFYSKERTGDHDRELAHAALSAYLEDKT